MTYRPVSARPSLLSIAIPWKALFIALMICMSWGLPLSLIEVPRYLSSQILYVTLFPLVGFGVARFLLVRRQGAWPETMLLLFLIYCVGVSFVSNSYIFPVGLGDWLPGLFNILPLAIVFFAQPFGIKSRDAVNGLLIAASLSAILIVIDRLVRLPAMDAYLALATQDLENRRVVLMHNETAIACVLALARALTEPKLRSRQFYFGLLALLGFALIVVSESRLAIAGALIAAALFLVFVLKSSWKPVVLTLAAGIALFGAPVVLGKYIANLAETSIADDSSNVVRNVEIEHFGKYFDETDGLGFGLMSLSPNDHTILSDALYGASEAYGIPKATFGLVDIRIYAALYQFGWIGLVFVLWMTFVTVYQLWRAAARNLGEVPVEMGAVACVVLAYMLSPLPINFFTVDNTVTIGGILWLMTAEAVHLRQRDAARQRRRPRGLPRVARRFSSAPQ